MAKVIKFIENTDSPVHISFDVSALDPEICNSTGNWVAGGMEPEEVKSIIHHAIIEGKLVSMDVVEFNAKIGAFTQPDAFSELQETSWRVAKS